jgi:hypothetical protein
MMAGFNKAETIMSFFPSNPPLESLSPKSHDHLPGGQFCSRHFADISK